MTLSESATCFKIKDLLNNYNIFNTPLNTAENELTDEVEERYFFKLNGSVIVAFFEISWRSANFQKNLGILLLKKIFWHFVFLTF